MKPSIALELKRSSVREDEKQKVLDAHVPEFLTAVGALGFEAGTPAYKTFVSKFVYKKKTLAI